ncbi:MAG: pyrroloquinoline quinone biosynthesis protein PqqB [Ectothiorhodospiraceae bacterium]|nr:pyrroloquinoline quinone biosynthesis protein PqqB [Ectothiorhodospiraceae bacterium]MCH8504148.1 pyrroloquinoline quinone biosynthesis protein PqqB [Ectothiorhodospiraceae bacterium]
MRIRVLGSAAGGGFPQWNCNCPRCRDARSGRLAGECRTQSSIAVSVDNEHWLLINASPDIRAQILATPELQPGRALRDTGIAAVLLMDSQIDHVTGLLMLRESAQPLQIYCSRRVEEDLRTGFPILEILSHYCGTQVHALPLDGEALEVGGVPGLRITPVPLTSKAPPYSPHRQDPQPGDNVGLLLEGQRTGGTAFYAPGLGEMGPHLHAWMDRADVLLVDGTTWTDDEMQRTVDGRKTARDMGHLPQHGPGGMIEQLQRYARARRILIHINNTNPILDPESAERRQLEGEGIEVSHDGMVIDL